MLLHNCASFKSHKLECQCFRHGHLRQQWQDANYFQILVKFQANGPKFFYDIALSQESYLIVKLAVLESETSKSLMYI